MYYISNNNLNKSFYSLKDKCSNSLFGILGILYCAGRSIEALQTYEIHCSELYDWLTTQFSLSGRGAASTNEILYVRFSETWIDYVAEKMMDERISILDLAIFLYKREGFENEIDNKALVNRFIADYNIPSSALDKWFTSSNSFDEIEWQGHTRTDAQLQEALGIASVYSKQNVLLTTISFSSPYLLKAEPYNISAAPFIQTLYASIDTVKCLILAKENIDYLYPNEKSVNVNKKLPQLQVIYYGAPGTGKSHKTDGIIKNYPDCHLRTTFHPDTDYSSFVGCYKPTKEDDGKLTYKFVPQVFLKAYVKAWRNPDSPFFLIIEEINRGNCAQIFGDIFQLLDRDMTNGGISKYDISPDEDIRKYLEETFAPADFEHLPENLRKGERMQLPGNLYILATMNTSDQSLFPIDSAFKRRWAWSYIPIEQGKDDKGNLIKWQIRNGDYAYDWWEFVETINYKIEDVTYSEDKKMGFWFTRPENELGYITREDFISKVLFYLWNDVYKDLAKTDETIFKGKPAKEEGATDEPKPYEIFFTHFFRTDGSVENRLRDFMRFNGITENEFVEPQPEKGDAEDDEDGEGDPTENLKYWQNFRELLLKMPIGERLKNYKTPSGSSYQIALPNSAGLTNTFVLARIAPKQNYCRVSVGINGEVQADILSYLYEQKDAIVAKVQELTGDAPEWYESDSNHIYVNVQRDGLQPEWQAACMQKLFDYFVKLLEGFHPKAYFKTSTGHKVSGDYQNRLDEAMSKNHVLKDAFYRNHGGAYHLNVPGTDDIKIACYNLKDHVSMAVRVDKDSPTTLEWLKQNIQTLADALGETPILKVLQRGYPIFFIDKPGSIDYDNLDNVNEAIAWHIEKSEAAYNALAKLLETK